MISLDMRTVIFSFVLSNIACMSVMVLLWRQNRTRFAGMDILVFYYVLQTIALFLMIMRGIIPDFISILLAHTLILAGLLLGYIGLLKFTGMRSPQVQNYILLVLTIFLDAYFMYIKPDLAARYILISIGLLFIYFQCAWLTLYRVPASSRLFTRNVGIVFGAYCVINIISIIWFSFGRDKRTDLFQYGTFDTLILISYQMLFILLTYSLVLMFNKRLHMDIATEEEKFSKAFHSSPYAILLTRLSDGQIIEANDGFMNITGYQFSDIKEKTTKDLRLWVKSEDWKIFMSELTSKGKVQGLEFQFRIKSGEIITGIYSAEIITINNEKCVLASINDITSRKRMEEALKASNNYLEKLNNALGDAIFVVNYPERVVEYFNDAAIKMFEYTQTEVLGKNSCMFYPDKKEYLRISNILNDILKHEKSIARFESIFRRKDGEIFPGWLTATFIKENDITIKLIVIIQDITEQKRDNETIRRLNEDLEKRVAERTSELRDSQMALLNLVDDLNESAKKIDSVNRSLEAINKELATFSYSASHDLRAPLRSIDGFSNILLEDYSDTLDNQGKNYLERIRRATQHMGQLIDDMLNLSRVTQSEINLQDVNLSIMVRTITDANQQRSASEDIAVDIQDGIIIRADQRLMNIAMTNILDNAFKFTGKIEHPRIQFGADVIDGETVIFVRDNGVGFDMASAVKLFGAFQRFHRADEFPGTGIGLATVQRIINRHGGRIWAQSEPGKGTTFYFTLPP